ncbi:MAG: hypothetical protein WB626_08490 [Bacteroidota bacterium]
MKWFHHECAAKHDPKLQTLGAAFGAEGAGIYWGLLEEIGRLSDTFHLRITGLSPEADARPLPSLAGRTGRPIPPGRVPVIPFRILARMLFTTPRKLEAVLGSCVEVGLFDGERWSGFSLLYSPSFELRADDYSRRQLRKTNPSGQSPRSPAPGSWTLFGESPDTGGTPAAPSPYPAPTDREPEGEEIHMPIADAGETDRLSTAYPQPPIHDPFLTNPSPEDFRAYARRCLEVLHRWEEACGRAFSWRPAESELRKLFYSGTRDWKTAMCRQAMNLLGERVSYPELVLRAFSLMLDASARTRIQNPFGWLWSCLHGNGGGTPPWVQLITAREEPAPHPGHASLPSPGRNNGQRDQWAAPGAAHP